MTQPLAITGATGLLGAAVLAACERPVRALVRSGTLDGVEVVRGDLSDPGALAALVDGCSAVLHLATAMGSADDATMFDVNVGGTRRLLEAAGDTRVVFTSSVAARDPSLGAYAQSKAEAEELVLAAGGVVLRLPVLYGPGTQVEKAVLGLGGFLPLVPAVKGQDIRPLHLDDAAKVCLAATEVGEGRYTLAGPEAVSFPGFASRLLKASGKRSRALPLPARPLILAARILSKVPGFPVSPESLRAAASGTPAADARAAELGFEPRPLSMGLAR